MARLPSEEYLIQQDGGFVRLFEDGSERLIAMFDPGDVSAVKYAVLETIPESLALDDEDRCFAQFWAGYFAAHAGHPGPDGGPVTYDAPNALVGVLGESNHEAVVSFNPRDVSAAARAQGAVHFSDALSDADKSLAHFWCGYYYGLANV